MKKLLLLTLSLVGLAFISTTPTYAASNFEAGRIIDDSVFTDKNSMSAGDIQAFLNSKVTSCDTWGTQTSEFGGGTRRQWGEARGLYPPYTCLKDYSENSKSAAQVIYDVAQEFAINPQVLIVLLQKEQGLVTDTWPTSTQYKTATGYGCPDTAPCDSQYFGLTNQLRWSGRMFRAILNNSPTWYTPYVLGDNYIQYSPTSSCGGSTVNIQNRSTQALYNYTPYQPNQAALDAGWGQAPCGAYGNRNFYLYFTSWFGNTTGPSYAWQAVSQTVYKDNTKNQVIGWNSDAMPGDRVYVKVTVKNTGSKTWVRDNYWPQVQIGTWGPQDRTSAVCDSTWIRCSRAATHNEATVAPGEIATFEFWAKTPTTPGTYGEAFNLVADGLTWMQHSGTYIQFKSTMPTYTWQPQGQTIYTDNTKQVSLGWNAKVTPKQRVYAVVKVKNTGNVTWYKTDHWPQVQIGTWYPQDRTSAVCDSTWIRCSRAATHNEATVAPGEIATFEFWMQTPDSTGVKGEAFNLVADGLTWMNPAGLYIQLDSAKPTYTWDFVWQGTFSDQARTQPIGWNATAAAGSKVYATVKAKNTGNVPWYKTDHWPQVQIGTWYPQDRTSASCTADWIRCSRAATHNEDIVYPGQIATFDFSAQMPNTVNQKNGESLNLVADGLTWMNPTGLYVTFTAQ